MKSIWSIAKQHTSKLPGGTARLGLVGSLVVLAVLSMAAVATFAGSGLPNPLNTTDATGTLSTYSTPGPIDTTNAFFQSLGTNGRSCGTCHVAADAWTITPADIQARFSNTGGTDPVFRPVDGANCPSADVSTVKARKSAYGLLLNKGLIRVSFGVPPGADFQITAISDPYNCAQTTPITPAMYRRPLPATNLPFLATVMWDGRESPKGQSMTADLTQQALDATLGHAEASSAPSAAQLQQIVAFETALFTAQINDSVAGSLTAKGAGGGPQNLSAQQFYIGINDPLGGNPTGAAFDPNAFTAYGVWANESSPSRASVARGEALFNTLPIMISGVAGLNDALGQTAINGTCTTCHDAPNIGNHSVPLAINIGIADYPGRAGLDVSGLPVYTITCTSSGTTVQTTDPGRAMVTGKCGDVGKTKGPILRGLAARAPYFHNGSARSLNDVVTFYNQRFNLNLTAQQQADLVAFLSTL